MAELIKAPNEHNYGRVYMQHNTQSGWHSSHKQGGTNHKTGKVIYTPPAGEKVIRDLLSNWEKLLHKHPELIKLVTKDNNEFEQYM